MPISLTAPALPPIPVSSSFTITPSNQSSFNGRVLAASVALTITIGAGLTTGFSISVQPPLSGNVSIASNGTVLLNGATTTIAVPLTTSYLFSLIQTAADAYAVSVPTSGSGFINPMTTGGDMIYGGAAGVATRLANGTAGQVLTSNGTTLAPSWQAGGGGITIGTTTITGGTPTRLLYDNGGVVGEITGATTDGTTLTLVAPALGAASGTSLALGGATRGSNALAVTGASQFNGDASLAATDSLYVYNTADQTTNYERGVIKWSGNQLLIGSDKGGTGTSRVVVIGSNVTGSSSGAATLVLQGAPYRFYIANGGGTEVWNITNSATQCNLVGIATAQFCLGTSFGSAPDVVWGRTGAAHWRAGTTPSATPAGYTLTVGEDYATGGTTNQSGGNATIQSGLGVGSGAASKIILQVPVVGGSSNTAQSYGTAVTINSSATGGVQLNGYTSVGLVSTDASGNLTTASAMALKENFREFQYGLDTVLKITPQWWRWRKETGWDTKHEYSGFVADEVEALIPELSGLGDPTRTVLAACVNAIRELNAKIGIVK